MIPLFPLFVALLVVLAVPAAALGDPPRRTLSATDELRGSFDEIMAMAQSPKFRALEAPARREAVRKVADRVFNWSEIARRALGTHWRDGSAKERRTFSDWFAALAERAYTGSIAQLTARDIPPDAIRYLGEVQRGGETVVRTVLVYPRELALDFVMSKRAARWEVCDVHVDGVSAVENYRAQFARILGGRSFPALVDRMNEKTAAGAAAPRPTPEPPATRP